MAENKFNSAICPSLGEYWVHGEKSFLLQIFAYLQRVLLFEIFSIGTICFVLKWHTASLEDIFGKTPSHFLQLEFLWSFTVKVYFFKLKLINKPFLSYWCKLQKKTTLGSFWGTKFSLLRTELRTYEHCSSSYEWV